MKTYVLTVSRVFPKTHKKDGKHTYFVEKIQDKDDNKFEFPKIHTIRSNYELWEKRIKEVQDGKAILSIRYWSGKPYNSKQVEICQLDKNSGIGVQKLMFRYNDLHFPCIDTGLKSFYIDDFILSINDGLLLEDFKEWFKDYDLSKTMAIIHFTSFRY